jgi:hypothetical protein
LDPVLSTFSPLLLPV